MSDHKHTCDGGTACHVYDELRAGYTPDLVTALRGTIAALEGKPCRQQAIDDARAAIANAERLSAAIISIDFSVREIDWLNNYAGNKDLSIPAAVRQAVRVLSLIEGTPGAWDAINNLTRGRLGPKYDPMPPLSTVR